MNNNELQIQIDRLLVLSSHAFLPIEAKPRFLYIIENTNPLEQLDILIDFVFIDHRNFFAKKNDLFEMNMGKTASWESKKMQEWDDESRKIMLDEINDILMDIGYEIIEGFSRFVKSTYLEYTDYLKIESIKKKMKRYQDTREHNLQGIFVKLASNIQEVIKDLSFESKSNEQSINKKSVYDIENITEQAVEILKEVFSGKNRFKQKIMTDQDYRRLLEYTIDLIENDKLPEINSQIPKIKLTDQFILTTYRKIYDLLEKDTNRRKLFTIFINNCFGQFQKGSFSVVNYMNSTIYKKFTRPERSYNKELEEFSY